ncbi:GTP-binding protein BRASSINAZOLE INSENSITIVE PALE GREEN 2, chloroplastic isoform X2 [Pistacia vera]|uniref:GTP-binding protein BRASSINAZOLE INSENSITIVE PALE GREEN 2, chloroplastic isoform X2 n=1 Tax=Pistacia vera TaxID=55513 RepID=UPI00126347D7|nr:GTP-binding protein BRASSINAZOLE INSENSITIVE PALE GREEN 2, chloroplastic isoform X2 [Pistacia vera]
MAVMLSTTPPTPTKLTPKSIPEIPETKPGFFTGNFATFPLYFPSLSNTNYKKKLSLKTLAVNNHSNFEETISNHASRINKPRKGSARNPLLSEGRDEDEKYGPICPGCGVFMQDKDPNLPGYYQKRKLSLSKQVVLETEDGLEDDDVEALYDDEEEEQGFVDGEFDESSGEESGHGHGDVLDDWDSDEWEAKLWGGEEDNLDLDGFKPAGVGYGNITEETLERLKKKKISKAEKKRMAREAKEEKDEVTVCARCHSLRNYGQVKNQLAENLIPDFDFDRLISSRLIKSSGSANASVIVMVVDCVDFDGMFPKRAAKSLFKAMEGIKNDAKISKKFPKLVLVATKVDLLPSQVSPTRLDRWVRHRAKAAGAPKLSEIFLISARKDLGVRNLLTFIKELAGPRGNVWVIGAQNAGKSTLINMLAKKEGLKVSKLTEAPIPGTTLGILRIGGILPAKAKMYDTPGLLHPHLMAMRLNRDEQKMVEIRKELQPRTYRVKPPIGQDRASELGKWEDRKFKVSGTSWDVNSIDIAAAGLGWFSLGLKGDATLSFWTYDGIEITLREPLVLDRAPFLERPGFWLPKLISDAIGNQSKLEAQKRKKLGDSIESLSEVSA